MQNLEEAPPHLRALVARAETILPYPPDLPVRVADLARATGVSSRTIYRVFGRVRGAAPIAYFRRLRLEQARRRLLAAKLGDTITSVAMDCGFFHLGRFSEVYRRGFGERPSETLRRGRASG